MRFFAIGALGDAHYQQSIRYSILFILRSAVLPPDRGRAEFGATRHH